ncbi:MAG: RNA polymerase sigma factor [Eubacterium sp.]
MNTETYSWDEIDTIIQRYSSTLYKIAYSYTGSKEDSEDVLQEVFIKYANEKNFKNEEHKKAWLIRVTINKSINIVKSAHRRKVVPLGEKEIGILDELNNTQNDSDMKNIVLELPLKYRAVIFLYYYEGYKVEEIAAILNKKTTSVYTLLRRGRDLLKKNIEEGDGING